jgi:predicted O-methyltransferase YrrM
VASAHRALSPANREFARFLPTLYGVKGFLHTPKQERWLYTAARALPDGARIVEIGSYQGRSTICLATGCAGSAKRIHAVDPFQSDGDEVPAGDFFEAFQSNLRRAGVHQRVVAERCRSTDLAKTWNLPIHLLFIDGSHTYENAKADFEAFYPYVVPGGIVALHDVDPLHPGVLQVWREEAAPRLTRLGHCGSLAYGRRPSERRVWPFFEEWLYREPRYRVPRFISDR